MGLRVFVWVWEWLLGSWEWLCLQAPKAIVAPVHIVVMRGSGLGVSAVCPAGGSVMDRTWSIPSAKQGMRHRDRLGQVSWALPCCISTSEAHTSARLPGD